MQRILVYGSSIFLAGLIAQLQRVPQVCILCRDTLADLGDLTAIDVVLVDLNDARAGDVLAMLRARPDLQVIGVNAASSAVTMFTGRVYLAQNVEDVVGCLAYARQGSEST